MDKIDTICAALVFLLLFAVWAFWYQSSSAQVRYCMDHYAACQAAYYQNK